MKCYLYSVIGWLVFIVSFDRITFLFCPFVCTSKISMTRVRLVPRSDLCELWGNPPTERKPFHLSRTQWIRKAWCFSIGSMKSRRRRGRSKSHRQNDCYWKIHNDSGPAPIAPNNSCILFSDYSATIVVRVNKQIVYGIPAINFANCNTHSHNQHHSIEFTTLQNSQHMFAPNLYTIVVMPLLTVHYFWFMGLYISIWLDLKIRYVCVWVCVRVKTRIFGHSYCFIWKFWATFNFSHKIWTNSIA